MPQGWKCIDQRVHPIAIELRGIEMANQMPKPTEIIEANDAGSPDDCGPHARYLLRHPLEEAAVPRIAA